MAKGPGTPGSGRLAGGWRGPASCGVGGGQVRRHGDGARGTDDTLGARIPGVGKIRRGDAPAGSAGVAGAWGSERN